jgi:hypothetical protein
MMARAISVTWPLMALCSSNRTTITAASPAAVRTAARPGHAIRRSRVGVEGFGPDAIRDPVPPDDGASRQIVRQKRSNCSPAAPRAAVDVGHQLLRSMVASGP